MIDPIHNEETATAVDPFLLAKPQPARASLAIYLSRLSCWLFIGLIITLPWRQRLAHLDSSLPPLYGDFTDLILFTSDLFWLSLLLVWLLALLAQPRRLTPGPFFLWWPLAGLTLTAAVSLATAADPMLAGYHALRLLLLVIFFIYVVTQVSFTAVTWAVASQTSLQVALGLGQVWRQRDLGLAWLGEHALDLEQPTGHTAYVWAEGDLMSLRAYGLADHPNILAISLALGMLLLATGYVTGAGRWRPLLAIAFALGNVTLFLTFSRPAWLAFTGGVLVSVFLFYKTGQLRPLRHWAWLAGFSLLCLLPAVWLMLPYLRLGSTEDVIVARVQEQLQARAESQALTAVTNDLFIENPLTGVGIGGLPVAMRQAAPDFAFDYQPARMTMLTVAAEIGLFGALFYFILLAAPWISLALQHERLLASPLLVGVSGVLAAVTIFNLFDAYTWFYPSGRLWQWLVWGLWAVAYRRAASPSANGSAGKAAYA